MCVITELKISQMSHTTLYTQYHQKFKMILFGVSQWWNFRINCILTSFYDTNNRSRAAQNFQWCVNGVKAALVSNQPTCFNRFVYSKNRVLFLFWRFKISFDTYIYTYISYREVCANTRWSSNRWVVIYLSIRRRRKKANQE